MDTYTVSLFGHRYIDNLFAVEQELEKVIRGLLLHRPEFTRVFNRRQRGFRHLGGLCYKKGVDGVGADNSTMTLVLAYTTAELRENENARLDYYGEIEVCELAAKATSEDRCKSAAEIW